MSIVTAGVIRQLSVSQVERFDETQTGGCPRRWYFETVEGHYPEQDAAQTDGDKGHELLATYLATGQPPQGRVKMGKHVRGAIAAGHLPPPGPDLIVERRFDGQPKRGPDGRWLPLDAANTLHLAGLPWDGFVDLQFRRADLVEIWDHKFSSDINAYAKPADSLISTVQMPVYALNAMRTWPDAHRFRFVHHYVSRRGVESFIRSQHVGHLQVYERKVEVEALVARMQEVARATSQEDVPFNRQACNAYSGCPHQSRCTAFRRNAVNLSQDELDALFGPVVNPLGGAAPVSRVVGEILDTPPEVLSAAVEGLDDSERSRLRAALADPRVGGTGAPLALTPPVASTPAPQAPPSCPRCGEQLNPENGSRSPAGVWTHIACPAAAPTGPKCNACPHPAHEGKPCPAKRGRGACRCGQARPAGEVVASGEHVDATMFAGTAAVAIASEPLESKRGHLPTCVQADSGKWMCMEGCSALTVGTEVPTTTTASAEAPGPAPLPQWLAEKVTIPPPAHPFTGTLRIEIDASDRLVTLINRLLGR